MEIYDDPEIKSYGYDKDANDIDPNEAFCLAKKSLDISNNTYSYWVKMCLSSFSPSKLFDPETDLVEELRRFDNYTGKNKYHYRKVSEECFNHYISYLTTKKTSFIRNADRSAIA